MAACYFFLSRDDFSFDGNSDLVLPKDFSDSLRQILLDQGAHVATLNYDDLLYECFVGTDVFKKHILRDGFFQSNFNIEKHNKLLNSQREGWFLHLHGSPLFVTRNNESQKLTRGELRNIPAEDSTHLVLTNVKHKLSVIESSEILLAYWSLFEEVTKNAKNIVVIGYSGKDIHLNAILSKAPSNASIRVVEWEGSGVKTERLDYWKQHIDHAGIDVVLLTSILDFRDWAKTQ